MIRLLFRFGAWSSVVMWGLWACGSPCVGQVVDRAGLRRSLESEWKKLTSIRVIGEEFPCDPETFEAIEETPNSPRFRFEFALQGRYERSLVAWTIPRDRPSQQLDNIRCDGKRTYKITGFQGDPHSIDSVSIDYQSNDNLNSPDAMNPFVWLFTPGGQPLYRYLTDRSPATAADPEFPGFHQVKFTFRRHYPYIALVDDVHGNFPKRIHDPGNWIDFETLAYENHAGFWIPVEGRSLLRTKNEVVQSRRYKLLKVAINELIPASVFTVPGDLPGVVYRDLTKSRTYVSGGDRAREKLLAEHVVASVAPSSGRTTLVVVSVVIVSCLAISAIVRHRSLRASRVVPNLD